MEIDRRNLNMPTDSKIITIKVPANALVGSVTLIYDGVHGLSLKTRTFDFQPHGNDEIDFTDKDGDE